LTIFGNGVASLERTSPNVADVSKATVSRWTTGKAALLLEFEGLIIPSAWYDGLNIVVFLVVLTLDCLTVIGEGQPVN